LTAEPRDARGRRGFGHTQDRRAVIAGEADLIRDAAGRVLRGETLVSVVDDWNGRGVTTTTGGPWRINALSALLIQPRLAGADASPAILDRSTHEGLLALRRGRRRPAGAGADRGGHRRYLLGGYLVCWRCGGRVGGTARSTTTGRPCYRCPSRGAGGCSGVVVPTVVADDAARNLVLDRVDDPAFMRMVEARTARLAEEEHGMAALLAEAVMGADGRVGAEGLWTESRRIDDEAWRRLRRQLEQQARRSGSELAGQALLGRQRKLCSSGDSLRDTWDTLEIDARRSVIGAIVDHFVVLPARRPSGSTPPGRLRPVWRE
jgi:site-specific DNA recombinase